MAVPNVNAEIERLRIESTRLRQGLVSRNTSLGYGFDFRMWEKWCAAFGLASCPAAPETLSLYLTALLSEGKKISTVRRRRCAIIHEHRRRGFASPDTLEVQEILTGVQRLRGEKPRQMKPITVKELRQMSIRLARIGSDTALRNRAILVLGFATSLRRANLAALNVPDIEFCRQGLIVSVNREKQDQKGMGRFIGVARGRHVNTCPTRVLRAWLRVRGGDPKSGPLFPRLDQCHIGEVMDGECVCRIVKKCLVLVGIDPRQRGAHSLRSGCVSALAEANLSTLRISQFTGQSPEIVKRYFRRSEIWKNNCSASLGL